MVYLSLFSNSIKYLFVLAESNRLKFSKKSRHRFACHQYGWRRQESLEIIF